MALSLKDQGGGDAQWNRRGTGDAQPAESFHVRTGHGTVAVRSRQAVLLQQAEPDAKSLHWQLDLTNRADKQLVPEVRHSGEMFTGSLWRFLIPDETVLRL